MRDMKIGKKLVLAFVIVSIIASLAGIVGLGVTWNTDRQYSAALVTNGFSQGDIGQFGTYFTKTSAILRDIIFLTEDQELQAARQELEEYRKKADDALVKLKGSCQTPKELEQIAIIEQNLPNYRQYETQVLELGLANRNEEALALFRDQARPLLNACTTAAEALAEINVALGNEVSASLTSQSNIAFVFIAVVILAALVASILFGFSTARSISRPLEEIEAAAKEMSEGSLRVELRYQSKNELGNLADSMRVLITGVDNIVSDIRYMLGEMAEGNFRVDTKAEKNYIRDYAPILDSMRHINSNLNNTLTQINQSADMVSSGSDQVSSGAQALSQGATEQASSVEELAATIAEISKQVKGTAENAAQANGMAAGLGGQMAESNQKMQDMMVAMGDIKESSNEIGKIIKTIEDIAFQTNILALNAAVEAARAGAAGKGFAVVADEVRNLASKSADASKDTSALIERALGAVERGSGLAGETAAALSSAVGSASQMKGNIEKISAASGEQAQAIEQVTQGIDQISAVVQTNSATAEESAAASEELSGQAQILKRLVGGFKLKQAAGEGPGANTPAPDPYSGLPEFDAQHLGSKY